MPAFRIGVRVGIRFRVRVLTGSRGEIRVRVKARFRLNEVIGLDRHLDEDVELAAGAVRAVQRLPAAQRQRAPHAREAVPAERVAPRRVREAALLGSDHVPTACQGRLRW